MGSSSNARPWPAMDGGDAAATLLTTSAACTVLLDHNATQCQSDGDCAQFGEPPLLPERRLRPVRPRPDRLLLRHALDAERLPEPVQHRRSACRSTTAQRLGLCGGASNLDAALVSAPAVEAGRSSSTRAMPTRRARATRRRGASELPSIRRRTDRGQVLVMTGSSNFPPLLAKLAPLVLATGYTPVFQVTSSCHGVRAGFGTDATAAHDHRPAARARGAKYAAYYAAGRHLGFVLARSGGAPGRRRRVGHLLDHVRRLRRRRQRRRRVPRPHPGHGLRRPRQVQQTAITAEAARAVFGMGGQDVAVDRPVALLRAQREHGHAADDRPRHRRAGQRASGASTAARPRTSTR